MERLDLRFIVIFLLLALWGTPHAAHAQAPTTPGGDPTKYILDDRSGWTADPQAEAPTGDAALIARAKRALAEDRPREANEIVEGFIETPANFGSPWLAEALLIRADAKVARDREFDALYDYERLIREFPESEHFVTAIDRERRIAELYLDGLELRIFGFRWVDSTEVAIELMIRVQERLPGSAIAEQAAIRLADFYYDRREMRLARDAYEVYLANFPAGPNRIHAEQRLILADIARFKGPRYDGSGLLDARIRIEDFIRRFPRQADTIGVNEGLIARIDESTAAQLLETARWYLDVGDEPAARYTLRRLLSVHPETISAQRSMEILENRGWLLEEFIDEAASPESAPTGTTIEGPLEGVVEPTPDRSEEAAEPELPDTLAPGPNDPN
jgi:outer membrane protein assembly factor BamD (BamD/ComL family)